MWSETALAGRGARQGSLERPVEVVQFWRAAEDKWFVKDKRFDSAFRDRCLDLHMAVAARRHDRWMETPEGALALLILTDQFPRNAFRGTGHMYATDPLARLYARQSQALGHMERVEPALRLFFCLPFSHSEDEADQDIAVSLNRQLGQPWLEHAEGHRDIIRRFGRFPHRNPMLGRETTREEAAFLNAGGFRG
ncbi:MULTISPECIES: DUF924 family protein [unclassified Chelatococcus]|uniref:DUF924 family protein n=1 Tax=unclassified Chelatococcus TaxID=2638111 RepID=UPI001BD07FC8|nr:MULTISPECIES: DUF924 family protein [unclassified Chelatococcus]CAH1650755.1 conserved hypothetical protein [Hyphomicrobiales bacterium]MBS7743264.1 DUF924 family protein [Chelatococcus sp. HY11]MBX3541618.1 DUF924 family protein [Chelatococcus sp.]MCO5074490.1 DUF924 family protein [Chelatococcus sp.]CAH1692840.1 conserved hypothetical protein [Hyphomicrobiales bacterium]